MTDEFRVFVVDDDAGVVRSLELLLRANAIHVEGFTSAAGFLARPPFTGPGCVLLDLQLGDDSGLAVQDALRQRGDTIPVVFLSGRGDVPTTARAMRDGAMDFLEKPVDEPQLLAALARARDAAMAGQARAHAERDAAGRLARLTRREREVCDLVARGLLNKQIAAELGSSENTIKVHRARVMRKLGVDSVAALVRLVGGH